VLLNVLHLTDLHLKSELSWDQEVLLNALLDDLERIRYSQHSPQLVLFTGDLAYSGAESGVYTQVSKYLSKVLAILELDPSRLIFCPGNHDADRHRIAANEEAVVAWRSRALDLAGANELAKDEEFNRYASELFSHINDLRLIFGQPYLVASEALYSTYFLRDLGLGLVALNSASLTGAGLPNLTDQAKLVIPERALVEAIKTLPDGVPLFFLSHHPLTWLNEANASLVETVVSRRGLGFFNGHLHMNNPRQSKGLAGSILQSQAGALYSSRSYWNGFALTSIDTERGLARISFRRWFEPRREFSKAEDLGDDGVFYSSDEAKAYFDVITPNIDVVALERWREITLLPSILNDANEPLPNQHIDCIFVPPHFDHEIPFRTEVDGRVGSRLEKLTFQGLVDSTDNYVVSAQPETGKSTMLRAFALALARKSAKSDRWSIPVVIQFAAIRPYKGYLETLIRQKLPELPAGLNVRALLETGGLTILVDDVDFSVAQRRKALVGFVSEYPKCRYVFTSSTTFVETSTLRPEITPDVPFTRVRLRAMEKGQLLTLIENYGTTDPRQADQMLERVLRDVSALNVPLTAVTGTFLIQILQDDPDHTVLNQAALIERYIEMLLEKYAPRELLPGTFDFKNKVDLLCTICEQMVRSSDYTPTHNTILQWCIDYLTDYGLNFNATDLMKYFLGARILEKDGDNVQFRLRMFFEFFTATRMVDSEPFRNYVFDDENYLSFINEIGFYSALSRRDKAQLERIFSNFDSLARKTWAPEEGKPDADALLQNYEIPGRSISDAELEALFRQIKSNEQLEQDRRALLEGVETGEDDEHSQVVCRPQFDTDEERWLAHLILVSGMVKHTELIPDADKRRFLKGALQGWVQFAANSLGIVAVLAKERRVTFNGVTYKSTLPENLSMGEVARRLSLSMPSAAARMATTFLGTEKLQLQLREGLGGDEEPPARQFMRLAVLADLGLEDISTSARQVAAKLKGSRYLQHVLARKLYEVAVRFRLPKHELDSLRAFVSEMYVNLESAPKDKIAGRKNQIIEGMARQRLLIERQTPGRKPKK